MAARNNLFEAIQRFELDWISKIGNFLERGLHSYHTFVDFGIKIGLWILKLLIELEKAAFIIFDHHYYCLFVHSHHQYFHWSEKTPITQWMYIDKSLVLIISCIKNTLPANSLHSYLQSKGVLHCLPGHWTVLIWLTCFMKSPFHPLTRWRRGRPEGYWPRMIN